MCFKCYDTTFDETFIVFVHSANVDQANAELNNEKSVAAGLALKLECWDHHTIGKNSRIGAAHILLRPLLALGSDGGSHEMIFEKDMFHEGELVVGQDGQNLHLTVSVMLVESEDHKMVWQAPTLADSLLLADGSRDAEENIADAAEEAVGTSTTRTSSFLSFLPDGRALKSSEYSVESNQDLESRGEGWGWWRPFARRQNATTKMKANVHLTVTKRFSMENMHKKAASAQNSASSKKGQSSLHEHDDETVCVCACVYLMLCMRVLCICVCVSVCLCVCSVYIYVCKCALREHYLYLCTNVLIYTCEWYVCICVSVHACAQFTQNIHTFSPNKICL